MKVKIINKSNNPNPKYATEFSAGMDLQANIVDNDGYDALYSGEYKLFHTGIYISLPVGYEAQIRSRSGLALKYGISVLNSPGTIDADYIGEICVILINQSKGIFGIKHGDKIAQMVISKHEVVDIWENVDVLSDTVRGDNGFGSSDDNGSIVSLIQDRYKDINIRLARSVEDGLSYVFINDFPTGIKGKDHSEEYFKSKGILDKVLNGICSEINIWLVNNVI